MHSPNAKGRSRYSKVLPDPPRSANSDAWEPSQLQQQQPPPHRSQKPLPVPASLSPGVPKYPMNTDKVKRLKPVASVNSINSMNAGHPSRPPQMFIFRRHKITPPSLASDEEPPALSHSWSDSSIEEKDSLSSDPEFEFDHIGPPPPPPPATDKPKVILSDNIQHYPLPLFSRTKRDNNKNNKNNSSTHNNKNSNDTTTKKNYNIHPQLHHKHSRITDDSHITPPIISSSSLSLESPPRRPAKIDVHRSLIDLRSKQNYSSLRNHQERAIDPLSSPWGDGSKKLLPIDRKSPSQPDLMGNKLVKLKKNSLGDLKSHSIRREADCSTLSGYLDREKSPPPTTTNVSSSYSSFNNAKSHAGLRQAASRDGLSNAAVTKSDSRNATSVIASSHSSGSTTRAPTIPSSEALTLRSESSMSAPLQPQYHLQRHLPLQSQPQQQQYPPRPHLQPQSNSHSNSHLHPNSLPHYGSQHQPHPNSHPYSDSHPNHEYQPQLIPQQAHPQPTTPPDDPGSHSVIETIIPGPPLDIVQFDCYQKHRSMRGSRNRPYPVGCMMCQKSDAEMRWRCTWCCLSACEDCNRKLSGTPNKDLRSCLKQLGIQERG